MNFCLCDRTKEEGMIDVGSLTGHTDLFVLVVQVLKALVEKSTERNNSFSIFHAWESEL